jgi:hypothetical protein
VLLDADPADARGRTLADIAQQAGPAADRGTLEDPGTAGAGREDPHQQVEGLADGPGVRVGPEVTHPFAFGAAHDLQPRELLVERHSQVGVALVVAVTNVEPRVILLDPGIFELERLDLGVDRDPVDGGGRGDHLLGARVHRPGVGEVGVEPLSQALGLADIDHPAAGVAEAINPRLLGNRARRRPEAESASD